MRAFLTSSLSSLILFSPLPFLLSSVQFSGLVVSIMLQYLTLANFQIIGKYAFLVLFLATVHWAVTPMMGEMASSYLPSMSDLSVGGKILAFLGLFLVKTLCRKEVLEWISSFVLRYTGLMIFEVPGAGLEDLPIGQVLGVWEDGLAIPGEAQESCPPLVESQVMALAALPDRRDDSHKLRWPGSLVRCQASQHYSDLRFNHLEIQTALGGDVPVFSERLLLHNIDATTLCIGDEWAIDARHANFNRLLILVPERPREEEITLRIEKVGDCPAWGAKGMARNAGSAGFGSWLCQLIDPPGPKKEEGLLRAQDRVRCMRRRRADWPLRRAAKALSTAEEALRTKAKEGAEKKEALLELNRTLKAMSRVVEYAAACAGKKASTEKGEPESLTILLRDAGWPECAKAYESGKLPSEPKEDVEASEGKKSR